jgi:hypothetical protein
MFGKLAKQLAKNVPDKYIDQVVSQIPLGKQPQQAGRPLEEASTFNSNLT